MKRTLQLILRLMALALVLSADRAAATDYKISILPRYFPEKLTAMVTPLIDYLRQETGLPLELVLTKDFKEYEKRLKSGDITIGFENPVVYTRVTPEHQVVAMSREDGEDRFRGIVIAPADSGIGQIGDLRGKRVIIVGETSAGGYLSQKLTLQESGIGLSQLQLDTAADNRQENVIIAVSVGDAEAGFIRESALHVADRYIAPGSVKRVLETAWLPGWALSIDTRVPTDVRDKITEAVLKLPPGSPQLKALEVDGFVPAKDSDFDSIRAALTGK